VDSCLLAHKQLMKCLMDKPGAFRKQGLGIIKGEKMEHVAPSYKNVPYLMKDLFNYLRKTDEIELIKSCFFHYEMEFIHPFVYGNGQMGRLWQTIILQEKHPVFEFSPFETLNNTDQESYYKALADSDKSGHSTPFIH
jgi:Fic family protein